MGISEKDSWVDAAKLELDGAEPLEKLRSAKGSIPILPYYASPAGRNYAMPPSDSWMGARSWSNASLVRVDSDGTANKRALDCLATGADGIVFELTNTTDPGALLADIQLNYCSIFFTGAVTNAFVTHLLQYAGDTGQTLSGAVYYENPDDLVSIDHHQPGFRSSGLRFDFGAQSPEISVATLLERFVKHFSTSSNVPRSFANAAVMVDTSNDFFLEIARLKSIRILWSCLRKAYDIPGNDLFLHVRSAPWINEAFQPHGNLIASTTRALASVAGGCDALTIEAENSSDRIARNISLILRDESHLSKVADATVGSFYLDRLTEQICEGAWKQIQLLAR